MMEINTTPLIDVMLVLIIVLIMSIPVMTHATKLDMPQTNNPPPPVRPEVIQIDIDFDGTIVWNGTVVSGIPQLESFFRSEREQGAAAGNSPASRSPFALRNHGAGDGRGTAQSHEEDGLREHGGIPGLAKPLKLLGNFPPCGASNSQDALTVGLSNHTSRGLRTAARL